MLNTPQWHGIPIRKELETSKTLKKYREALPDSSKATTSAPKARGEEKQARRLISECTELEKFQATAIIKSHSQHKPGIILSSSPANTRVKVKVRLILTLTVCFSVQSQFFTDLNGGFFSLFFFL